MRALIDYLARRVLYIWVRTTILPARVADLAIDPARPVLYVTEARSWANLLALEEECTRAGLPSPRQRLALPGRRLRAVYCVAPRPSLRFWRGAGAGRSPALASLLAALHADPALDVQVLPVSIFWGRAPARERSWLEVLFADTWSVAGRTRKLFTILLHGRHTLVYFAPPLSLRALAGERDAEAAREAVHGHLAGVLAAQRAATLGPDMSHRRTLVKELLRSPGVSAAIAAERERLRLTAEAAQRRARSYLEEIAANSTGVAIQLLFRVLSAFWNRFYDGIDVHHAQDLAELARGRALVYVPCHRSHVDYLLLSYVIYTQGLAIPSIAAGRNLDLPLIGSILRRGGAFFIRRSFRDDRLYAAVLFEYLSTLVSRGAPVEYFVEGTRSRTGRLLPARVGMLAMTVRGYLREPAKPVTFVPVYIGYEKLIEARSYLGELKGQSKRKETLLGALRSVLALRGQFGKVSVSFGQPLALDALLDRHAPGWRDERVTEDERPTWLRGLITDLGRQVLTQINCAACVNPVNLVSLIVLSTPRQAIGEAELCEQLDLCLALLRGAPYAARVTLPPADGRRLIDEAQARAGLRRRRHVLGDILYFGPEQAVLMTYYRNNVLHLLALPSIIACCFSNLRSLSQAEVLALVGVVYPFLRAELFLHWDEAAIAEPVAAALAQMRGLGLLRLDAGSGTLQRPGPRSHQAPRLALLARAVQPLLERYFMILSVLQQHAGAALERQALEEHCIALAQRLAILHELETPDFFDRRLFDNFVDGLIARGYAQADAQGRIRWSATPSEADADARLLLGNEVRNSILELTLRQTPAHSGPDRPRQE